MANFKALPQHNQLVYVKQKYQILVREAFIKPDLLKQYFELKLIDHLQLNKIIVCLDSLNKYNCVCCREINNVKLTAIYSNKVPVELYPLIDVAKYLCNRDVY